jgi:hypothetical protein
MSASKNTQGNRYVDRHNAAVLRQKQRNVAYKVLAELLPGDNIHHVAPTSNPLTLNVRARMEALDAAKMKRLRKAQKRAKQCQSS